MIKVLLQMGENDGDAEANQYQKKIVSLCDNEGRNILHRILRYNYRSNLFQLRVFRFVVAMAPTLLYQRDNRGLNLLDTAVGRTRPNVMSPTPNAAIMEEYRKIKFLVYSLEFYARIRMEDHRPVNANVLSQRDEGDYSLPEIMDEEEYERYIGIAASRNVFQTACLLPQYLYTLDLIRYLSNRRTSSLEARDRSTHNPLINMATEVDGNGNRALHLFVSNKRWSGGGSINDDNYIEFRVIRTIWNSDRAAISTVNGDNMLPLQLAMQAGRRRAITTLTLCSPKTALRVDGMNDTKLFVQLLGLVSQVPQDRDLDHLRLEAMFILLRGKPEVISRYYTVSS